MHRLEAGAVEGIEAGGLLCILFGLTDAEGLLMLANDFEPRADGGAAVGGIGDIDAFEDDALWSQFGNGTDGLAEASVTN